MMSLLALLVSINHASIENPEKDGESALFAEEMMPGRGLSGQETGKACRGRQRLL